MFMQNGDVKNFRLSNSCSAGNGMLLQAMADQFGIPVKSYADVAFEARLAPKFSYGCAVFLDSDRVNFQKEGYAKEELLAGLALVGAVELLFFVANSAKILEGGWFPLVAGGVVFVMLTTWKRVEAILHAQQRRLSVPIESFRALVGPEITRVAGTAVYLSPDPRYVPATFMHNLKFNKVLHERIVFVSVVDADVPRKGDLERTEVDVLEPGAAYSVRLHYGFMEEPDLSWGLQLLRRHALSIDPQVTTFFLGKTTLARPEKRGPFTWRRDLFRFMQRNSPATAEYFNLLPERVVELGTRVSI